MKKRILSFLLFFLMAFPDVSQSKELLSRGLFVSVIQDPPVLSSREEIKNLIIFARKTHVKELYVQTYRANKSWFHSTIADQEPYETCFKNLSEDPFALLIKEAHASGIKVHAWMNLLSLSANEQAPLLKKYGTEILTRNLKKKRKLKDYKIDGQYFLEPGDLRVREALSVLVGEILTAYPDLDGIQFDYIRYPDMHPAYGYTKMNMERYKKATGRRTIEEQNESWKKWKRDQVTGLLERLVKKARAVRPNIQVSATGCMPYVRAYYEAFQDWPSWLKAGLVDFVTVMSYPPDILEFKKYLLEAKDKSLDFKKINVGIGAYKLLKSPGIFERQWELCEESKARACVVLHYGSLLENPVLTSSLTTSERTDGR